MNKKTRQHRKDHEPDIRLGHTALTGVDTGKGVAATDVGLGSEHHQPRRLSKSQTRCKAKHNERFHSSITLFENEWLALLHSVVSYEACSFSNIEFILMTSSFLAYSVFSLGSMTM